MVPLYTGTEPDIVPETSIDSGMVVDPLRILPKNFTDDMPFVTDQNNPEQLELADGGIVGHARFGYYKKIGDKNIKKPTHTIQGNKWPDKETKNFYEEQIKERFKYAKNSNELLKKYESGKLLTNEQLAKKYNISTSVIKRINKTVVKDLELENKPVVGREESLKKADIERKKAQLKFSNRYFEQKVKGTYKAHLGHMGDLYNRIVTGKNLGYTPVEINQAMSETLDPILRKISEAQDKLIENKPPGWKQKLEEYNKKGVNYSSLAEGYKSFDITDPDTLKKYTYGVDYLKTIDPAALYEGKPIKEIAQLTDKDELNKIQRAFDNLTEAKKIARTEGLEQADISKIKNSELLTEENLKKLQNFEAFEKNKEAVLKAQSKIPASEKKKIVQMIGSIGCPTYAIGGRVNFSEGTDCYNKGLKKLEEGNLSKAELNVARRTITQAGEEGSFLKNILDKAGSGIRFTGVTFDDLMAFGRTPGGRALGYGVGVGLPAYFAGEELLKGNIKQAGRELGYIPTLGFGLPESLVGSVKTDLISHAKEKGFNVESIEKILNKNEISKKINTAEELLGYGKEANLKDPEKFNKPIQDKIKSLYEEYDNITLNNADQENLNKTLESFYTQNRERVPELFQARTKISENVQKDIGLFKRSELDPAFAQEEKINIPLEKIKEPVETVPEELPSEYKVSAAEGGYIDYVRDYNRYASGGRIHLGEGGGGPKLSRRGFLGFLAGAAASPFVIKAMKGKKLLSGAKVATKVLPKVAGMPDWFNPLVTRIMNEGVDISPKAERVEDMIKVKKLEFPMPEEGTTKFRKSGSGFEKKNIETITMTEYPDGRIEIEADVFGSSFDAPFTLEYRPPRSDINLDTGAEIKSSGDFTVIEQRPKPDYGDPGNFEIDYESMSVEDAISDLERVEKIATGKRIHPKRVEQRTGARKFVEENPSEDIVNRYGDSEIEYDRMKDEGLFDD
jgi:hypothetical protein